MSENNSQMKSFITPSEVIEFLYCPRFIYFMNVLKIKQHEDKRTLVNKGREIHELKLIRNKDYIRKKLGCLGKETDVYLSSQKLNLVGKVDEVLFLENQTAAPLDYKYAFWDNRIYKTLKIQQTLYALLIEEKYRKKVEKAFLVFVRSKDHIEEFQVTDSLKQKALDYVNQICDIINSGCFPKKTTVKTRCLDCTYKNLCF